MKGEKVLLHILEEDVYIFSKITSLSVFEQQVLLTVPAHTGLFQ